jgi:molybdenum cofactor biosynthesis protein B
MGMKRARKPAGVKSRSAESKRHAHAASAPRPVRCVVLTISDSRGPKDDGSGDAIVRALERAGHEVLGRAWVKDDFAAIRTAARRALARVDADAVLLTGGSGIAPRDVTPQALAPLLDVPIPGFGECFRARSLAAVGSAAWLSRAGAAVARGRLLVWLPGSTRAVKLAMNELLLPELAHAVRLLGRFPPGD